MGQRSRKDPAGHQARAKGAPTPEAPQNAEPEPVVQVPPPTFRMPVCEGAGAQPVTGADGNAALALLFWQGDTVVQIGFPADEEQLDKLLEGFREAGAASRDMHAAAKSAIVTPDQDRRSPAEIQAAMETIKKGPNA